MLQHLIMNIIRASRRVIRTGKCIEQFVYRERSVVCFHIVWIEFQSLMFSMGFVWLKFWWIVLIGGNLLKRLRKHVCNIGNSSDFLVADLQMFYFCRRSSSEISFITFQTLLIDVRLFIDKTNFAMTDVLQFLLFFWLGPGRLCTAGYFQRLGGLNFP